MMSPNSGGNMQKHGYLWYFQNNGHQHQGKYIRVLSYWEMRDVDIVLCFLD